MSRRGRLDDFLHHDELDEDETGATVVMDGSSAGLTSPFGDEDDEDEDSECAATVVMGSSDVHALMEAEGLLDETFDPWVEEQETRLDQNKRETPRVMDWIEPGGHDAETQRLIDHGADTQLLRPSLRDLLPQDPQTTLADGEEEEEEGGSVLVFGMIIGLLVGGIVVAAAVAVGALLLL